MPTGSTALTPRVSCICMSDLKSEVGSAHQRSDFSSCNPEDVYRPRWVRGATFSRATNGAYGVAKPAIPAPSRRAAKVSFWYSRWSGGRLGTRCTNHHFAVLRRLEPRPGQTRPNAAQTRRPARLIGSAPATMLVKVHGSNQSSFPYRCVAVRDGLGGFHGVPAARRFAQ